LGRRGREAARRAGDFTGRVDLSGGLTERGSAPPRLLSRTHGHRAAATIGIMTHVPPAPYALTMGDACGIGPEILARLAREAECAGCIVVGDVAVMRRAVALTGGGLALATIEQPADAKQLPPNCLAVLQPPDLPPDLAAAPLGRVDARAGAAAAACIRYAVELALS